MLSAIEALLRDLRVAMRSLRRSPLLAMAAILSLALGTGVNVSTFSIVNAALLRPLPYPDASHLYLIGHADQGGVGSLRWSFYRFQQLQRSASVLMKVAAFTEEKLPITSDPVAQVALEAVSTNYFATLGVQAVIGHTLDSTSAATSAVISYKLWAQRFNKDPSILGTTLSVNGVPLTVSGVAEETFGGQSGNAALWVAADELPTLTGDRDALSSRSWLFSVLTRVPASVNPSGAIASTAVLTSRMNQDDHVTAERGLRLTLTELREAKVDPRLREELAILLAFAICVLFAAVVNVGALLLSRSNARRRAIAIRQALGARARDILSLCIAESLVLSVAGTLLGLVLGNWSAQALWAIRPISATGSWYRQLTAVDRPTADARVWAVVLFAGVLVCVVCSLIPFVSLARGRVGGGWRSAAASAPVRTTLGVRITMQGALNVAQVASAFILLLGTVLFATSLSKLLSADPGFQPDNLVAMRVTLSLKRYPESRAMVFYEQLLAGVQALARVKGATVDVSLPMSGEVLNTAATLRENHAIGVGGPGTRIQFHAVGPQHFSTMRIPIVRGRGFDEKDATTPQKVAVISQAAATKFWGDTDPIGQRVPDLLFRGIAGAWNEATIIGIAGDVKYEDPSTPAAPAVYVTYTQAVPADAFLIIRSSGSVDGLFAQVRAMIKSMDPDVPMLEATTLHDRLQTSTSAPRFVTLLLSVYTAIALSLLGVGIYSLIAFSVARRQKEIAIRLAIGSSRRAIVALVGRQALGVLGIGIVVGSVLGISASQLIGHLLYGIRAVSPVAHLVAATFVSVVVVAAAFVPALRATRIDPLVSLSAEP